MVYLPFIVYLLVLIYLWPIGSLESFCYVCKREVWTIYPGWMVRSRWLDVPLWNDNIYVHKQNIPTHKIEKTLFTKWWWPTSSLKTDCKYLICNKLVVLAGGAVKSNITLLLILLLENHSWFHSQGKQFSITLWITFKYFANKNWSYLYYSPALLLDIWVYFTLLALNSVYRFVFRIMNDQVYTHLIRSKLVISVSTPGNSLEFMCTTLCVLILKKRITFYRFV